MKVTVYHFNWDRTREESEVGNMLFELSFGHNDDDQAREYAKQLLNDSAAYTPVAEVEVEHIDEVFYLTNSVNDGWWKNERVNAFVTHTRSTSVGDLYLLEDGSVYIVRPIGLLEA